MSLWGWLYDLLINRAAAPAGGAGAHAWLGSGYDAGAEEDRQRAGALAFARSQLGKPYRLGAEVLPDGRLEAGEWDCSELTEHAYGAAGLWLPDGAQAQHDHCRPVPAPRPGDLGFLWSDSRGMVGHVMLAGDDGTVVHAVGGRGVVEDPAAPWEARASWRGWRRHPDWARPPGDRA